MADRKKGMEIGMAEYANIIVDIYQGKLDKTFQYRVPERLRSTIAVGMLVAVPFGSRKMQGYVIELTDVCEYEEDKIKEILSIVKGGVLIESQMIALAGWMRENYGGTMNHALKTVLPVKEKKKAKEQKTIRLRGLFTSCSGVTSISLPSEPSVINVLPFGSLCAALI